MNNVDLQTNTLDRRAFFHKGSLYLLGAGLSLSRASAGFADQSPRKVRLGLVTDMHYADKPPAGSRHYRESLTKLGEAAEQFERDQVDHIVELGDFIDAAESIELEKRYLKRIYQDFAALPGEKHYVLGNHCVDMLTKVEFLEEVGQKSSYYSFDEGGFHFVILDACFRGDGEPYGRKNSHWTDSSIPEEEIDWLRSDLASAEGKTIVFVHQRLDVSGHYGIKTAAQVRKVLEDSGKVLAVFQGHSHKNDLKTINGIHYCVLRAMIEGSGEENNGYSTVDVLADGTIRLSGHRQQSDYEWRQ